jgi:hypothetical protein
LLTTESLTVFAELTAGLAAGAGLAGVAAGLAGVATGVGALATVEGLGDLVEVDTEQDVNTIVGNAKQRKAAKWREEL